MADAETSPIEFKLLSSGYFFARWSREVWAQWPATRDVQRDDFFHPDYTYSPERAAEAARCVERLKSGR